MVVPVFTHPDCLRHDPGSDHPETPARLRVLLDRARQSPAVTVVEAPASTREPLLAVHSDGYLREVEAMVPKSERIFVTGGQEIARPLFYLERPAEGAFPPDRLPSRIGGLRAVHVLARAGFGPDLARFGKVQEIRRSRPSPWCPYRKR